MPLSVRLGLALRQEVGENSKSKFDAFDTIVCISNLQYTLQYMCFHPFSTLPLPCLSP